MQQTRFAQKNNGRTQSSPPVAFPKSLAEFIYHAIVKIAGNIR